MRDKPVIFSKNQRTLKVWFNLTPNNLTTTEKLIKQRMGYI